MWTCLRRGAGISGLDPREQVASICRLLEGQLRELIAAGATVVYFHLKDGANELKLCGDKWEELQEMLDDTESESPA